MVVLAVAFGAGQRGVHRLVRAGAAPRRPQPLKRPTDARRVR
jgi:hypothetical protein